MLFRSGVSHRFVDDYELPQDLARWQSTIRKSAFRVANGFFPGGREVWTIVHEGMHALEGHNGVFNRSKLGGPPKYAKKLYRIERTTDGITAAFIAPADQITLSQSAQDISFRFGLSLEAAKIRMDEVALLRGSHAKARKEVPGFVRDLLDELKKNARKQN